MPIDLLELLDVHHLSHIEDQQRVLRLGHSLDGEEMTRAAVMVPTEPRLPNQLYSLLKSQQVKTPQVKQWLHALSSSVVLVEGCGTRPQAGRVAPLSHVCATFIQILNNSGGAEGDSKTTKTTLFFFCGQHVMEKDSLQGPQGLMRSLLAQLILTLVQNNWVQDSTPIKLLHKQGFGAQELENFSLQDVCQLFHQLLSSVPSGSTVFALVDGISYFEHSEVWRGEFELVIGCLARITADDELGRMFKLLLTSPTTASSPALGRLDAHQRVRLRAGTAAATQRSMARSLYS